ncbi:MAG: hybrid sensor histidine kinase/response regulator [Verrucomicrobia bacterium]|nr:hybrid sensor histidine kinase/response regulator [Verrucomicrobiota bacterium]
MSLSSDQLLKRLKAAFKVEAEEHCQALSTGLLQLEKAPPDQQPPIIEAIFREAHSLKGAARAVSLSAVESVCQQLESLFAQWKRRPAACTAGVCDTLHRAIDAVRTLSSACDAPQPGIEPGFLSTLLQEINSFGTDVSVNSGPQDIPTRASSPASPETLATARQRTQAATEHPAQTTSENPRERSLLPHLPLGPREEKAAEPKSASAGPEAPILPVSGKEQQAASHTASSQDHHSPSVQIEVSKSQIANRKSQITNLPSSPPPERLRELATFPLAETVRVPTAKLERLLIDAEEMLAAKLASAQRAAELRDVQQAFQFWKKEWARIQPQLRAVRQSVESRSQNVGQTSCLPVDGASLPRHSGGRMPPEPAGWKPTPHSPTGSDPKEQTVVDRESGAASARLLEFFDWNFGFLKLIESKTAALAMAATEDRQNAGQRIDDLLEAAKQLFLLPFSTLLNLFPKLVRDLARDQAKDADLVIQGGEVEIDKRILETMKDPLMHLVRNCIDHGVEKPETRARLDKPSRATILLTVSQLEGNKVEIRVSDDGAGVDVERIKQAAVQRGIIAETEAGQLDHEQALALIFRSEVSTSPIVTEISGRGLGLAIVQEKVEKLGGRVSVQTQPGLGTTFQILLPVTLATFHGVLVEVSGQLFIFPAAQVERVHRVRRDEIKTVENRETISLQDRAVSLVRLRDALRLPRQEQDSGPAFALSAAELGRADLQVSPTKFMETVHGDPARMRTTHPPPYPSEGGEPCTVRPKQAPLLGGGGVGSSKGTSRDAGDFVPVIVLHASDKRVAFGVDAILHEEEVLVKPFRKPLARVRNISGAAVLGSGRVVPVLNVTDLLKSAATLGAPPARATDTLKAGASKKRAVLVVEDSITSRMLLKNILESAGYQVKTAVDGLDALTTLRTEAFDLVVSDVEMPRMNGFDLTAAIRGDRKLAELPVILVTALASREDRERGIDAGANAYIAKSSFDQSNLLEIARRLV